MSEVREIRQTVVGDHNIFTGTGDIRITYQLPPVEAETLRLLRQLADRVQRFWGDGVLKKSLYDQIFVELGKTPMRDAVAHPWNSVVEIKGEATKLGGVEQDISEIFLRAGRTLLILGEAGSGKTVTLLKLADELLCRFASDPTEAVPVVFNLSTWGRKRVDFLRWLVGELNSKYGVPKRSAQSLVQKSRLILLLDGLDELPRARRPECLEAINRLLTEIGAPGIAVCSRLEDYLALPQRFAFEAAIRLEPLTCEELDTYLAKLGEPLAGLREATRNDGQLRESLRSPLLLSTAVLAYAGNPHLERSNSNGTPEDLQQKIFADYVARNFRRRSRTHSAHTEQQIKQWLSALAKNMQERSITVVQPEELQSSWLRTDGQRWLYAFASRLMATVCWAVPWWLMTLVICPKFRPLAVETGAFMFLMILVFGSVAGLFSGIRLTGTNRITDRRSGWWLWAAELVAHIAAGAGALAVTTPWFFESTCRLLWDYETGTVPYSSSVLGAVLGFRYGITFGLLWSARGAMSSADDDIKLSRSFTFSFRTAWRGARSGGLVGFIIGALLALLGIGLTWEQTWKGMGNLHFIVAHIVGGLAILIVAVVGALCLALVFALFSLLVARQLPVTDQPGRGWYRTLIRATFSGAGFGILFGAIALCFYLTKPYPAAFYPAMVAVAWALPGFMFYGGFDLVFALTLRVLLALSRTLPWKLREFFEQGCHLTFLRRIGPGYMFIHRELLDFIADDAAVDGTSVRR
jgi:hypothetical protein